jgi:hypothetical protein
MKYTEDEMTLPVKDSAHIPLYQLTTHISGIPSNLQNDDLNEEKYELNYAGNCYLNLWLLPILTMTAVCWDAALATGTTTGMCLMKVLKNGWKAKGTNMPNRC